MKITLLAATLTTMLFSCATFDNSPSTLWGEDGEAWHPESRLPDFSFAGYHRGDSQLPDSAATYNIHDFGAKGDDEKDDSDAFIKAIEEVSNGVILIPKGRYIITKQIDIKKANLVLRGEGPEKTEIHFPIPLNDINPNWGATTGGLRTSNYSWSGGFIAIRGSFQREEITTITQQAQRGQNKITVADPSSLSVGQEIEISLQDTADNTLANHLYSGDPRISLEKLKGRVRTNLVTRITTIEDNTLTLDRPLRFDTNPQWNPAIYRFAPTVTESGIEGIRFTFPNRPYEGHFTELGYNAFTLSGTAHCWVRNIHIHNADSGGFVSGKFNTIDNIIFTTERSEDKGRRSTGHHGIILGGSDNLFINFDFQSKFIHDITVSGSCGNVSADGKGIDLALDHHRHAPYENLFTNIHVGLGNRIWRSGGGADLGAHCGARGTFWNISADEVIKAPDSNFGPWSMNLIGVQMDIPAQTKADQRWYEFTGTEKAQPANLHQAQLTHRLKAQSSKGE